MCYYNITHTHTHVPRLYIPRISYTWHISIGIYPLYIILADSAAPSTLHQNDLSPISFAPSYFFYSDALLRAPFEAAAHVFGSRKFTASARQAKNHLEIPLERNCYREIDFFFLQILKIHGIK